MTKKDTGAVAQPEIITAIEKFVQPIVADLGLELVEVQYRREPSGIVLRIIIYKAEGVSIDDCAGVSRQVAHILEVEDLIDQAYNLEVTSPGLDRPLVKEKDFIRSKGKEVKVITSEPVDGDNVHVGIIENFENSVLSLQTGKGLVKIDFDLISKAKLVIRF
ncbi:MAG: ribosome maturation factor RimP [Proteobacteria bacterium]|nr:ribosome maturation factor RimP [Pseudomonadota bacterium]MBU1711217.1 ribosome maturation factor RimP [Pseudomonadota bacterium]